MASCNVCPEADGALPAQAGVGLEEGEQKFVALLERVAEGDQTALAALYDATSPLVFGLLARLLADRSDAEEVLLDLYKQAWRQAALYDRQRGSPLAWLLTIARTRALDRRRALKRGQQLTAAAAAEPGFLSHPASPELAAVIAEQQDLVRAALAALPPSQREVIALAYYAGLAHREIAARLSLPLGTVKTRTRLGLTKLRELLSPVMEGSYEA